MKKLLVIILFVIAVIQIIIPLFTLATVGYDSVIVFVFDAYKCLVPAVLAGALIYLLRKANE